MFEECLGTVFQRMGGSGSQSAGTELERGYCEINDLNHRVDAKHPTKLLLLQLLPSMQHLGLLVVLLVCLCQN